MTWRRFTVLLGGLPAESLWLNYRRRRPLEGAAAERYFAGIGR